VNRFADGSEVPVVAAPDYSALERDQVARLGDVKARRDATAVRRALESLRALARSHAQAEASARAPLLPLIVDAVRVRASVGEISDVLRAEWGAFRP